jgi:hypothetical protein
VAIVKSYGNTSSSNAIVAAASVLDPDVDFASDVQAWLRNTNEKGVILFIKQLHIHGQVL